MLWQFALILSCAYCVLGNHYETLGVSRSATDYDIKKAYKKLARIWHPDKSRSPGASERFMKINEAYEILSDSEKRKEYDAFGSVSNEPRGHDGFHRNHFWAASFGNSFFHSEETNRDSKFEAIDYRIYKMTIVPESYMKPSLILLVTHFCASCHFAMRQWGNIADQVTDSGIRMTISDVMRDSRLREELKIHHVPSVVFIIDGQVKYMQADINKENIIEFLRQSFPRNLVHFIQSQDDLNKFHDLWMKDSRSKMILTKPLERASFRFLSVAFKYRDKVTAGFIYLNENERKSAQDIVDAYQLGYDEETLLIFNDEKQQYHKQMLPKPVAQISRSRLTIGDIEHLIERNHQLPLSRLLSQSVFDRACPPPSQKQRSFGFCVIAIVHSKQGNNLSEVENWQYLRSLVNDHSRGKILYLYADVQLDFLQSLQLFDNSRIDADAFINQVILLWRQSYESASSIFLSNPWEYPNLDWVLSNWNSLSNFDTAIPMLNTKNRIQSKFSNSESLHELVDELAASLIWRIWERFVFYLQQIFIFVYDNVLDRFTIIIVLMAFFLLSYSYTTIKAVSKHLSDDDIVHPKPSNPQPNNSKESEFKLQIDELNPESYHRLIKGNHPGKLFIVVLTTNLTPPAPLAMLMDSIVKLKRNNPFEPLLLRLDKHTNWLTGIVGCVNDVDEQRKLLNVIASLSVNRPVPDEGIVLALNINRNYLIVCPVNLLLTSPFPYADGRQNEQNVKKRTLRNATYYIDSDSSSDDPSAPDLSRSQKLENRFFDWLCQLTDGTCKRFHVTHWPKQL